MVSSVQEDVLFDKDDLDIEEQNFEDTVSNHPKSTDSSNLGLKEGYEWYSDKQGQSYYRSEGSQSDWIKFEE